MAVVQEQQAGLRHGAIGMADALAIVTFDPRHPADPVHRKAPSSTLRHLVLRAFAQVALWMTVSRRCE